MWCSNDLPRARLVAGWRMMLAPSVPCRRSLAAATAAARKPSPVPGSSASPRTGAKYSVVKALSAGSWRSSLVSRVRAGVPPTASAAAGCRSRAWRTRSCEPGYQPGRAGAAASARRNSASAVHMTGSEQAGRGDLRVGGYLEQLGTGREEVPGNVGVVPERLGADHDHQVVPGQPIADDLHRHAERPAEEGVVLWEGGPVRQRGPVHGSAHLLRQSDRRIPAAAAVHLRSEDQRGPTAGGDAVGEEPQTYHVGGDPVAHRPDAGRAGQRLLPVVHENRQVYRARGLIGPRRPRL